MKFIIHYGPFYERRQPNLFQKLKRTSDTFIYLITLQYHAAIVNSFYVNVLSFAYSVFLYSYVYEGYKINYYQTLTFYFYV